MKIVAIVGSPRLKGNTNYLVDRALEEAVRCGVEVEKIILTDYHVNPCLGNDNCASFEFCRQKDDAGWILDRLRSADGVILATPVYYYNVTAQMKNFIDRNYFIYKKGLKYNARVAGIILVADKEGIEDTLHTLNVFTNEFGLEENGLFVASGYADKIGDAGKNLPLVEEARKLGRQMAERLRGDS